jgi:signal transduction histidine kinase
LTLGVGVGWHIVASSSVNCGQHGGGRYAVACQNQAVAAVLMRGTRLARPAAGLAVFAIGLGALAIAEGPGRATTYAGASSLDATLTVAAGVALILAGLVSSFFGPEGRMGDLALLAGVLWFAPLWVGWDTGPALVRSIAMFTAGFTLPVLLHLLFAAPSGRLRGTITRALVLAIYLEATLAALGLALVRDPFFDPNCWANCTDNVFKLRSLPGLARGIESVDRWFIAAAAIASLLVVAWRLLTDSSPARRALLPFALPATLLAGAVLTHAVALHSTPLEDPSQPAFQSIFIVECAAVLLLAAALVWATVRLRLQRRAVAEITANLGQAPPPGSVQAALAQAVRDPELHIAYWLADSQRYVDSAGRPVREPADAPGRTLTPLVRDGQRIAIVSHTAALPDLERAIGAAVRLALENERLQAETLAQLDQLRASRVRVVETGDAERRQLERDLHDGAQQRLLALSYDLRLARAQAQAEGDMRTGSLLTAATAEAQAALSELRTLAHGIYPAILAEAGLAPAVATLAETAALPVEIIAVPEGRCAPAVETAAYLLVAEGLDDAAYRDASHVTVAIVQDGEWLMITIKDDGSNRISEFVEVGDRVGALDGRLSVEPTRLRAGLPCG